MRIDFALYRTVLLAAATMLFLSMPASASGSLVEHSFDSPALAGAIKAVVYQPDGRAPAAGWPVLYLLHGFGGNNRTWMTRGQIGSTLDRMIAGHEIAPLVVVMPDGRNSWYVDSASIGGPGNYETAIVKDLRADIEAAYPVRRDRGGRAIAGFSMGGFGALRLALAYPDLYSCAASLSGAIWPDINPPPLSRKVAKVALLAETRQRHRLPEPELPVPASVASDTQLDPLWSDRHFEGAFGTPFDPAVFAGKNVFAELKRNLAERRQMPAIFASVGDDDDLHFWHGAFAFFETMRSDNQKIELRVTAGTHSWRVWKTSVVDALLFVDGHLKRTPGAESSTKPLRTAVASLPPAAPRSPSGEPQ